MRINIGLIRYHVSLFLNILSAKDLFIAWRLYRKQVEDGGGDGALRACLGEIASGVRKLRLLTSAVDVGLEETVTFPLCQ